MEMDVLVKRRLNYIAEMLLHAFSEVMVSLSKLEKRKMLKFPEAHVWKCSLHCSFLFLGLLV